MRKVKLICPHCGSDEVRRDAFACWDIETQQWELLTTFDEMSCDACGEDGLNELNEVEVNDSDSCEGR